LRKENADTKMPQKLLLGHFLLGNFKRRWIFRLGFNQAYGKTYVNNDKDSDITLHKEK
jgi:hypothetical protein